MKHQILHMTPRENVVGIKYIKCESYENSCWFLISVILPLLFLICCHEYMDYSNKTVERYLKIRKGFHKRESIQPLDIEKNIWYKSTILCKRRVISTKVIVGKVKQRCTQVFCDFKQFNRAPIGNEHISVIQNDL